MLYLLTHRFCLHVANCNSMKNVEGKKVKSPCKDPLRYFPVHRTVLELCTEKWRSNYRSWGKNQIKMCQGPKNQKFITEYQLDFCVVRYSWGH